MNGDPLQYRVELVHGAPRLPSLYRLIHLFFRKIRVLKVLFRANFAWERPYFGISDNQNADQVLAGNRQITGQ